MSWVLRRSEEKLGRRLVLLVLADHAKDDGSYAWPSIETIAHESRMSRSQAIRCLNGLKASGAIVETGKTRNGTNVYTVVMTGGSQYATPGGSQDATGGVANPPPGGRILRPEPSLEQPSVEPSEVQDARATPPVVVARRPVTPSERALATDVLGSWNDLAGQDLRSPDWLAKIIQRHRDYPELTVDDHARLIEVNLSRPWWQGPATPSVIYGSSAQFERSMLAARNGADRIVDAARIAQQAIDDARRTA